MYARFFKRLLDIVIAICALIAVSPALLLTWIAIALEDGFPCIFRQERVGRHKKGFTIYKFRSMPKETKHVASKDATKLSVTRVGRFIRRTNLDELPQLFNILKGDMSVVGPRPALASQTELIEQRTRRDVYDLKPGLTGLAQVNSYDDMPEEEKVEWDSKYAQEVSFLTDVKIILKTFIYLLKPPPAY